MDRCDWKPPKTRICFPQHPQFTFLTSLVDGFPLLSLHPSSLNLLPFYIFYHNMLFVSLGIAGTLLVQPARYEPLPKPRCGSTNLHAAYE